jgi:hypothetical protein
MALTPAERERLIDSRAKIQSVARSLKHVNPKEVADYSQVEECLEDADRSLTETLRKKSPGPETSRP